ncbi:LytR/AlgR family response regulator transcription factor [Saccharicrinis aurantiacus]|uniref:LytR/AlgR family response regulator transcription factor n=1 Tax=Saccharicrinis aurantiacus TaxID=1849719 RepID=UPI00094F7B60|nr:LytTR family transcriptional regulator DNA-binding domain-containing protein [Saccharicrinis aurantiacus]
MNIHIVEDEILIAEDMAFRLTELGYNVVKINDNVEDAIDTLNNLMVDLVLIDINLKGKKNGIDLANIVSDHYGIPFIFLTSLASDSVINKVIQVKPTAFLLKPFNDKQVQVAIELAKQNMSASISEKNIDKSDLESKKIDLQEQDFIFLKKQNAYVKVRLDDILWLEAEGNYTTIYTKDDSFIYSVVLHKIEEQLPKDLFKRIHRSFVVNIKNVTGIKGNMLIIGDKQIPVSKTNRDDVSRLFQVI